MKTPKKIVSIVGPTASGKTDLAIQLANLLNGEIISADSRLVYKDFNIGTAKPSPEELAAAKHYMIDIVAPQETYTVSMYKREADTIIKNILSENKIPLVTGGTGLYIKALLEGLEIPEVQPDSEFREQMRVLVEENGKEALHKILQQSDPQMALKLHPNDTFRVIRALEVQKILDKPMSELQTMKKPDYDIVYIGLNCEDRDFLYERINNRVDIMHEKGLVQEVESLIEKYGETLPLMKTLGYREIREYFKGIYSLKEALEKIKKNTRNFAKRQLTWFRANDKIKWFFIDKMSTNQILQSIVDNF